MKLSISASFIGEAVKIRHRLPIRILSRREETHIGSHKSASPVGAEHPGIHVFDQDQEGGLIQTTQEAQILLFRLHTDAVLFLSILVLAIRVTIQDSAFASLTDSVILYVDGSIVVSSCFTARGWNVPAQAGLRRMT